MSELRWNADRFGSELAATLTAALAGARSFPALITAVTECAATAEAICSRRPMACAPGCPYCCVLNVAILLPEGMIIAQWLREKLSPQELAAMRERLATHRSWARWMDDEERIIKKMACPLLDETGSCGVHPVRPLACRGVTSLDSDSCRKAFDPVVTDELRLVPADLLRRDAYDVAFTSLAQALLAHGLDDRSIELGAGVLIFLEHPEYRELFLSGGRLPPAPWS